MDIAAFLNARYDEEQQLAEAATPGPWVVDEMNHVYSTADEDEFVAHPGSKGAGTREDAAFIAAHDPARVLADLAAKRRIVEHEQIPEPEPATDAELHARFAHPAWQYETTEGPRKAWEYEDVPPDGDGWERNREAGRNGWERFDYTEESYWRRLRPEGPRAPWVPMVLRLLAAPYAGHPDYQQEWTIQ